MDLQMLRVVLTLHTLQLLQSFLCNTLGVNHQAAVHINGQLALLVQFHQALIDLLVESHISREAGIKYCGNAVFDGEINPALKGRIHLLVGQFHSTVQNNLDFRCTFIHISGHVAVLAHVIGKSGDGIRRVVRNAVALKNLGVDPDAMSFAFLDLQLGIRADGVQLFLHDILSFQVRFLQEKSVALLAGMLLDIVRHHIQRSLLAVRFYPLSHRGVLKTYRNGNMHVAVDDTGHNEFAAQVLDLSLIILQAGFVAYVYKFSVLYNQSGCLGVLGIRSVDLSVLDNVVGFHNIFFITLLFTQISSNALGDEYRLFIPFTRRYKKYLYICSILIRIY